MADSTAASSQGDDSRPTTPIVRDGSRAQTYHFQWELASRRKGPGSVVSETTESRVGDGPPSRTDMFFENMDHGSATPSFPTSWSASTQGFNAISTVLNNPKTRPNPLKSSKAPQPPVNSPDLKRIRRKDFDPYLKAIGPAWQQFERIKSDESNPTTAFGGSSLPLSPTSDGHNGISSSSHSVFSDPSYFDAGPRSTLPPLSEVPSIYFNPSFDLSDPRTFAAVTEQDTGAAHQRTLSSPTDIALNHILQEKLSHYMDIVEQHLVQEIAIRSVPFFAALSNLQDLQTEGAACLSRIARLKAQLQDVDHCQARRGLEVVRLQSKRDNLHWLQRTVKDVREVGETIGMAKRLADEGDHFAALGLTETVQSLLERKESIELPSVPDTTIARHMPPHKSQESSDMLALPIVIESPDTPTTVFSQHYVNGTQLQDSQSPRLLPPSETPVDLSSLASLSDIPTKLTELRTGISLSLQKELLAILTEDLVAQTKGLEPGTTATSSENLRSESWKAQLHVLLDGLLRTSGIERAFVSYKEVALAQIRLLVQAHQANSKEQLNSTEDGLDPSSDNVEFVKEMDHGAFMRLMRSLYSTLLESVRTTQEHGTLIQITLKEIAERNQTQSELIDLSDECSAVVFAAAELACGCCAKLLNARSEQNVGLPWLDFLGLYNETSAFNIECEILCRTMIIALRGAVNSQAKAYLSAFHSQRISESAKLVEEETWSAVDVSPKYQRLVTALIEAAVSNPPEIFGQSSQTAAPGEEKEENGPNPKHVVVEDQQFYVVGATLRAIRLIIDYLSIIANLPLLTIDVMPKTIEFLKAFNSRTCQVVLGAGALRSAGLKNITARHLALASQSLTVMVTLIPYVRETFRRHLSPKQAVMLIEFDKLKRDFQEHQNEIYTKLISIMGDRLAVHCKSLQEIDWTIPNFKPPPNIYMEVLVKETATLHKVLTRYLSAHASELIMSQVFAAINHRLSEEYGKIELPSQDAKDRLLEDARYLHGRLSALPGVGGLSSMLETVVSDKRVVVPAPPEPIINTASPAPVPPAKPARRTLSSIFGKDSKFASKAPPSSPTPTSEKQEPLRPITEKDTETSPNATVAQKADINGADTNVPNASENLHTESELSKEEDSSTAPIEAIQSGSISMTPEVPSDGNNGLLADDTVRIILSSPNTEQAEPFTSHSQTASPTQPDGAQSTPHNDDM
ncbi:putative vacuolar sorting protein VPS45 [Rhizoctonia solani 123E]|uniref:Putative vacuolar sorting protein VPS45 n=1 Tax=Rhizoctonia solani 123E TaxID=1423351 RepID=A0A074SA14_9AGAM|nr:putative vacuolar sorting protein VPS45 [Rhizoctonia solani 123E]